MDEITFPSDPTIIGPGIWFVIHRTARDAVNGETINEFISLMNRLRYSFPCQKCRRHIDEYMSTHPFEPFFNLTDREGIKIGMFKWSWLFHNAVNTRLGKPYVDFETALRLFPEDVTEISAAVCTKGCGEESESDNGYNQGHNDGEIEYGVTPRYISIKPPVQFNARLNPYYNMNGNTLSSSIEAARIRYSNRRLP